LLIQSHYINAGATPIQGRSVLDATTTELIGADGTVTPLQVDPVWDPSWAFHPNYTTFPLQSPRLIPAGSTLHTTCTWANDGSKTITFPDEMCIFAAFVLADKDATCLEGSWQ